MQNFERLRDATSTVSTKFKQSQPRAPQDSLSQHGANDGLLDNAPDVAYGTNGHSNNKGRGQRQQQKHFSIMKPDYLP